MPKIELSEMIKTKPEEEMFDNINYPMFFFSGDTTTNPIKSNPEILKYPIIFHEYTFLDEEDKNQANQKKHSHFSDLKPIILEK